MAWGVGGCWEFSSPTQPHHGPWWSFALGWVGLEKDGLGGLGWAGLGWEGGGGGGRVLMFYTNNTRKRRGGTQICMCGEHRTHWG